MNLLRVRIANTLLAIAMGACMTGPVQAQGSADDETRRAIEQLQLEIRQIQQTAQEKMDALQRETASQIGQLQKQVEQLAGASGVALATAEPTTKETAVSEPAPADRLKLSGDFRLRYEYNGSGASIPAWDRGVLRGRLGARYAIDDRFEIGARLVTGDADNPRTADTTIGDFARDLELSLDQAYASFTSGNAYLVGGKFAKPFSSTELVWDGDVNPQGLGGYYDLFRDDRWSARLSGIWFMIDPAVFEDDSEMTGGQLSLAYKTGENLDLALHAAYYDYEIGTLDPTVPGGARGNNLAPGGTRYLSDFDLLDVMGSVSYGGLGERWGLQLVADYVKNLGAEVPQDTGYGFDIYLGRIKRRGDMLLHYGYTRAETDAVLGMFSHDNIAYPTNYEMHTVSIDYALQEHTFVGLTSYLSTRLDTDAGGPTLSDDWLSRTRLNLYFTF